MNPSKGNNQSSDSTLEIKNHVRFNLCSGHVRCSSDEPNVGTPFAQSQEFSAFQNGISIELLHAFSEFKLGIGMGINHRSDYNWNRYLKKDAKKIYALFELGNKKFRQSFAFNIQAGSMQGALDKKYIFFVGGGPIINFDKKYRKFSFSLNPFVEYLTGEEKDEIAYDCRYTPSGYPCGGIPYVLNFYTFTYNLSLIIQYNIFSK